MMQNCCFKMSAVCVVNVTEDEHNELVMVVAEQLVRKIHGLMSNTVYIMTVRAMTSVGRGAMVSASAATQPSSR